MGRAFAQISADGLVCFENKPPPYCDSYGVRRGLGHAGAGAVVRGLLAGASPDVSCGVI